MIKNNGRKKIFIILDNFEEYLGAIILFIMVSVGFVNVLTRYLIKYPLAFTEEIELALFVYLVVLGTAAAFKKNAHLCVSFFVNLFPKKLKKIIIIFGMILSILLFGVLFYYGILQVRDERMFSTTSEALGIPTWYYTLSIPIGCFLIIIRLFQAIYIELKKKDV